MSPTAPKSHYALQKQARDRQYDKMVRERDGFYRSAEWLALRALVLSRSPLCAACGRENRVTVATEVHHVLDRRNHPELALAIENLEPLCKACHSRLSPTAFGVK